MQIHIKRRKVAKPANGFQWPKAMKLGGKWIAAIAITLAYLIFFYFATPAISIHNPLMWVLIPGYIWLMYVIFGVDGIPNKRQLGFLFGMPAVVGIVFVIALIWSSPLFQASRYAQLLGPMIEGNFEADLAIADPTTIPTLDREMAEKLGNRKVGEIVDLVSQFNVSDDYTQISINNTSYRVSPLNYANIFRWLQNQSSGIPYYVKVNIVSGESELVNLPQPMQYSESEFLNRNVRRHLYLNYPTAIVEDESFEVDDNGHPYYVYSEVKPQIGLFGGSDVIGVFTIDAVSGEINRYDVKDVPHWVDRVYPAERIMSQINQYGSYQHGFWNSVFAKRGVIQHAGGYQYFVKDNDLYLYTGLTSVTNDESNIGFLLVNSRTKEVRRYNVGAATEQSAMDSAQGSVQEKGYQATFPLMINLNNQPVYLLSLKDNSGLIKLYALVDANNYQHVSVGQTVAEAYQAYTGQSLNPADNQPTQPVETTEFAGEVAQLTHVVMAGETHIVFSLTAEPERVYIAKVSLAPGQLAFLKVGDTVSGTAQGTDVKSIEKQ